jgi:alpha-amylase
MGNKRGTLIQFFHWYTPSDGSLWDRLSQQAAELAESGFTAVWIPPAYKGHAGQNDTGYGVYDLYDLGEFDQKGSIETKYGSKKSLLRAIDVAQQHELQVYADIVLNHRMGADEIERAQAIPYDRSDRSHPAGDSEEIEAYTKFTFPGRKGMYSSYVWDHTHFDAVDHNLKDPDNHNTLYMFEGKTFDNQVSEEFGNYDYLMGCDLDFDSEAVRQELIQWGKWFVDQTGINGFRLDAVKHIPSWFFPSWLIALQEHVGHDLFTVGEYWSPQITHLHEYINQSQGMISLFDVPLHFNFHRASKEGSAFPLNEVFAHTLVAEDPSHAVTFVANHDSQPLQALESVVEPWFKPLAYALILLRTEGYPCVFLADYTGAQYTDTGNDGNTYTIEMPSFKNLIDTMLNLRKTSLGGRQHDYFDHPNTIGWSFEGDQSYTKAIAVIMSNGDAGVKRMATGKPSTQFFDVTHHVEDPILTDDHGIGEFLCKEKSVSVWVESSSKREITFMD